MSTPEQLFPLARPYWKPPFSFTCGMINDSEGSRIVDIRGWGHLTGTGAHHLPSEQAEKVQDQLGEHLAELLTKYWNPKP